MAALLALLAPRVSAASPSPTSNTVDADWASIIEQARQHRVVQHLFRAIKGHRPPAMSPQLYSNLERHARVQALDARFMTAELIRIQALLTEARISPIAFKGPVLGVLAYGDPAAREFGDLDLLVDAADYPRAVSLLENRGLQQVFPPELARTKGQTHFCSEDKRVSIDLHRKLASPDHPGILDPAVLRGHTAPLELGGGRITTFTPAAALAVCGLQAVKARWRALYHLLDIAALMDRHGDACAREGLQIASDWRMRRALLVSLLMVEELLQAPPPEDVRRAACSDPVAVKLAREMRVNFFREYVPGGFLRPRHRLGLLTRDSQRERAAYALRMVPRYIRPALTPNDADRNWIRLPAALAFLYPFVRCVRGLSILHRRCRDSET